MEEEVAKVRDWMCVMVEHILSETNLKIMSEYQSKFFDFDNHYFQCKMGCDPYVCLYPTFDARINAPILLSPNRGSPVKILHDDITFLFPPGWFEGEERIKQAIAVLEARLL